MWKIELACVSIVFFYLGVQLKRQEKPLEYLLQYFWFALTSWCGENTMIRAYHFYEYNPAWSLFLDQVPLPIVLIWPVVIHSAWQFVSSWSTEKKLPYLVALMVWTDANLIEPISVQAGLWRWFAPGLFEVPPIGVLGWMYFAGLCIYWLKKFPIHKNALKSMFLGILWVVGMTHILLIVSWWGGLRWISVVIPVEIGVGIATFISIGTTIFFLTSTLARKSNRIQLLLRVPAALFFYILIFWAKPPLALMAYSFAFMPPYLVLTWKAFKKNVP
ncbi:MAG: hypothetical protein AABZ60_03250 [Planctomycetota bacterium]